MYQGNKETTQLEVKITHKLVKPIWVVDHCRAKGHAVSLEHNNKSETENKLVPSKTTLLFVQNVLKKGHVNVVTWLGIRKSYTIAGDSAIHKPILKKDNIIYKNTWHSRFLDK